MLKINECLTIAKIIKNFICIPSIKRTNSNQFSKLVEIMEANPEIAKGIGSFGSSKKNQAEYWDRFAIDLNSLGPPLREGKEWHKVC